VGSPTSPILESALSLTQHEVLQNFLQSLLNPKDRAASPGTPAVRPGTAGAAATASGKLVVTGPKASSRSGRVSHWQTDPDAGSGTEDG
jgi:hypothetical protein